MEKEFKNKEARIQATNEMVEKYGKQFPFNDFEFRILHDY
jgi:hypothetical protein